MLSNNTLFDKFMLTFTDDFFIKEICDKYDLLLKQKRYPFDSIKQMIIESIQTVDSPAFSYEPIEQIVADNNQAGTGMITTPKTSEQALAEQKRLTVNFRHSDGFLTYFCLLEHYFAHFAFGKTSLANRKPFTSMTLTTYSRNLQPMVRIYFQKCLFMSMPELTLSYGSNQRTFSDFSCTFAYTTLQPALDIPDSLLI